MGNKAILPSQDSPKADEDAVKTHAGTAAKIADKIVVSYLTAYFKAVTKILTVEDKGLELTPSVKTKKTETKKSAKKPPNSRK